MNKRILIFGKGFIGERLRTGLSSPVSSRKIFTFADAQKEIDRYKPDILINAVGYTGKNNVDDCEWALDDTLLANTFVPLILSEAALRNNLKFIHISTGCIYHFDYKKNKPVSENIQPDFYDLYYSRSKIYIENILQHFPKKENILIARIRIPLDDSPHPKNILYKLLKYKTVINIPNSVTYIPEFIKALKHLIQQKAFGVFNVAAKTPLRYPELLDVYRKYVPNFHYKIIPLKSLHLVRTNLILSTKKLEKTGFKLRPLKDILEECVQNYLKFS